MCSPCGPGCGPCDPCCGPFECSPKCYNSAQLEALPQCAPRIPPPFPKCITVQQPPRMICKKRVVFTEKIVPEPMVVNRCRQITIPKVVDATRVIKVPKLIWVSQMVREPRVIYYPSMIPDPYVVCYPKRVCEPREVCQSILCQPKPQTIDIPPPREYCCYPNGPINYKPSAACPPCPIGPCAPGGGCCPLPCFSTNQYPIAEGRCGPCGPCGPRCGPCGPCGPGPCGYGPCGPC
ncbi:DBF4-type zinc finger-containing protein 2 homolog isoform X2 [Drosophila guanche]|uniref:DBF4-type zinc finger-containing protein 2 homolog isoform X6 n=1 Tax=Drosophila guanche TaxID=7266 RepID=UPI001470F746|nr:DBF4-type zinc finger-containing protein 2 homolog isoform X6 [Drosophila guanche]XP_034127681.1 DBF4-type zinc finger-containing protein 2 homolog isoform X2 [Drosophila guanche]